MYAGLAQAANKMLEGSFGVSSGCRGIGVHCDEGRTEDNPVQSIIAIDGPPELMQARGQVVGDSLDLLLVCEGISCCKRFILV